MSLTESEARMALQDLQMKRPYNPSPEVLEELLQAFLDKQELEVKLEDFREWYGRLP